MGSGDSRAVRVYNGTRYSVYVGLHGQLFEYRIEAVGELRKGINVRITNGSYVQISAPEKWTEFVIECKDHDDREVKHLTFYSRDDYEWVVRNFGVVRQKPGMLGLPSNEEYLNYASSIYKDRGQNWKSDYAAQIHFYSWDVDNEEDMLQRDREDREALEEMKEAEKTYGRNRNWLVMSEAFHPKGFTKPNCAQKRIGQELIAACQIYAATLPSKIPFVWLRYANVASLKQIKDPVGWRIEIVGVDNVNDNLQFERIALVSDRDTFGLIHIQRGPKFTAHRIQEALTDSFVNQTEIWVTDLILNLRQQDRGNRNLREYNVTDCCKCWVSVGRLWFRISTGREDDEESLTSYYPTSD